jgi:hypothetical protein
VFDYDRSLLLSSFIEFVCCDVNFVGVCRVLFNVLSRSVFPFFCRGLLDETVAICKVWSVYGAYLIDVPFLYSIVFYVECRHILFFYGHVEFLF